MEQRSKGAQYLVNSLLTAQLVIRQATIISQNPIQVAREQSKGANGFQFSNSV